MSDSAQQPPVSGPSTTQRRLAAAAAIMVLTTFVSRIIGMVRMMVLTHVFGSSGEINAFFQALTVPDLMYFLLSGGALRTGFVPVFTEYLTKGQEAKAWRTFSTTLWALLAFGTVAVGLAIVFARELTMLVAPGWVGEHPELLDPCVRMMRLLFPAQVFFVVGGLLQGTLNARKHFLWPGLASVIYNCSIIVGAVAAPWLVISENAQRAALGLAPVSGVTYVALFMLGGALVGNVLVQIPPLRAVGAKLERVWDLRDEGLRRVLKLALPVIFGLAIGEINWIIVRVLCTHFEGGPVILEAANRLWKLPSGIFAAGIAIAIFPNLAESHTRGDDKAFVRDFSFGMRNTLFLMVPASLALGALRLPIVRLLYEHGEFSRQASPQVADVLLWLVPSMIAMGITYIGARGLYARQRMYEAVAAGVLSIVLCLATAFPLMHAAGLPGLSMANTIGCIANAVGLMWILRRLVGPLDGRRIAAAQVRCLPANAFLVLSGLLLLPVVERFLGSEGVLAKSAAVLIPLGVGMAGFLALAAVCRVEELHSALRMVTRRGRGPSAEVPPVEG